MLRIATAAALIPLLWVAIRVAPTWVFLLLALVAIGVAFWECYCMLERGGLRPFKWAGLVAGLAVVGSFASPTPGNDAGAVLAVAVAGTVLLAMRWRDTPREMLDASVHTVFPVLLVGLGWGYLVALRDMPGEDGKDLLLLLFLCVVLADSAAYYVGGALGRRPLAPAISPAKTWEGAAGGLVASVLGALIAHVWFYQRLPLVHAVTLGVVLGVAAIMGDLAESMLKRATGVKDSSALLPGHGGLLDRTDSLIFAGPLLYGYYRLLLQGAV